ncbi:Ig-like domain-containing protein [Labilibacter marinus]|uniref:Ig-like domain-containing protein n=1 Tax=Labilibacter marinus TaxID=1477105 RepID=UPI000950341F|nr:Ig-like domain-containing protein [Labilibacter marinus]
MQKNQSVLWRMIMLVLLLQAFQAEGQTNTNDIPNYGMDVSGHWRQMAPGMAGSNRAIYTDAVDPLKLWVTPDMGNDYITIDGGKHWESTIPADAVWTQRNTLSDECIVSDHKNNNIVLSLNKKNIYLSTDGGYNFNKITSYSSGSEPNSVWYTAKAHPTEAGTWYVANGLDNKYLRTGVNTNPLNDIDINQPKVWKITNITESTRTIEAISGTGMDASTAVFDIICHPNSTTYPDMLFAATSTGVYRKSNNSSAWVKIVVGCTKADYNWDNSTLTIYALQQTEYEVNGTNLLSTGDLLKTNTPETASISSGWTSMNSGLNINLAQLNINKNYFKYMLKSWFGYTNGEESTVTIPTSFIQDYSGVLCDPTDANKVYLSIWGGSITKPTVSCVWATNNGGSNWFAAFRIGTGYGEDAYWQTSQNGRTNRNVELGVADHKVPDFVKYENRGVRSMAISADGTVYVSAVKGYHTYKYNTEDDSWISVDNTQEGDLFYGHGNNDTGAYGVMPDIHHPGEMFVMQYEASAFKSTQQVHPEFPGIVGVKRIPMLVDIGPTWAPGQPLNTPITMASHPTNTEVFYYMSQRTGEIRKCTNGNDTHVTMGEPIEVPDVLNVPEMKCIYWSDLTIASDGKTMYAIAEVIDSDNRPMGQTRIYNPEPQKGIYKSTNEGASWTCLNNGLPITAGGRNSSYVTVGNNSATVKALVMDPSNEACLYAAVRRYRAPAGSSGWVDGGLFRSKNGSQNWTKMTIPATIKSVWDVHLHLEDGVASAIYISGGGEGAVADWGEGGVWKAEYKADGSYQLSDWTKVFDHPFTSHVRTSPVNEDIIVVVTRETSSNSKVDAGTFFSITGGGLDYKNTWTKFNEGRGSMMIGDITFDTGNPNRVWCAVESSGVYTGLIESSTIGQVDSIIIAPKEIEMKVNDKHQLNSTIYPLGISSITPSWKSLDEDFAIVSETGKVTALQAGQARIVVTALGQSDTITITINTDISVINPKTKPMQVYPNPVVNDKLFVVDMAYNQKYVISDTGGKVVSKGNLDKDWVDVSQLSEGFYLIKINDYIGKFIKG